MMKQCSAGINILYLHRPLENFKMNNNVFIVHIKHYSPPHATNEENKAPT